MRRTIVAATGSRPSRPARRGGDAAQPYRGLPLGLPGTLGGAADRLRRYDFAEAGTGRTPSDRRGGSGGEHRGQCAAAATVRCGDREVDGGLPLLPGCATGLAQRGGRGAPALRCERRGVSSTRGGAGEHVAAHDGRRCPRTTPNAARTCAPGSACCRRCRRCGPNSCGKWALAAPPPDAATGLFLLENVFGVWPVGRGDRHCAARPVARVRREGDSRVRAAHVLERARTPISRPPCTRGSTPCSTARSAPR